MRSEEGGGEGGVGMKLLDEKYINFNKKNGLLATLGSNFQEGQN